VSCSDHSVRQERGVQLSDKHGIQPSHECGIQPSHKDKVAWLVQAILQHDHQHNHTRKLQPLLIQTQYPMRHHHNSCPFSVARCSLEKILHMPEWSWPEFTSNRSMTFNQVTKAKLCGGFKQSCNTNTNRAVIVNYYPFLSKDNIQWNTSTCPFSFMRCSFEYWNSVCGLSFGRFHNGLVGYQCNWKNLGDLKALRGHTATVASGSSIGVVVWYITTSYHIM
jgi:hypothetical protein